MLISISPYLYESAVKPQPINRMDKGKTRGFVARGGHGSDVYGEGHLIPYHVRPITDTFFKYDVQIWILVHYELTTVKSLVLVDHLSAFRGGE